MIFSIILLIAGLGIGKYISTKDISEEPDNLNIKVFLHKNITFKYGEKGSYPFFKKSSDGRNWENVNIRNFWINIFPDGYNYYSMNSTQNTIWIDCFHSCHESDCETFIYDYFYSHDNGNTWQSLNKNTHHKSYSLSFTNDNDGTCYYEMNNQVIYLMTKDGGETWLRK